MSPHRIRIECDDGFVIQPMLDVPRPHVGVAEAWLDRPSLGFQRSQVSGQDFAKEVLHDYFLLKGEFASDFLVSFEDHSHMIRPPDLPRVFPVVALWQKAKCRIHGKPEFPRWGLPKTSEIKTDQWRHICVWWRNVIVDHVNKFHQHEMSVRFRMVPVEGDWFR